MSQCDSLESIKLNASHRFLFAGFVNWSLNRKNFPTMLAACQSDKQFLDNTPASSTPCPLSAHDIGTRSAHERVEAAQPKQRDDATCDCHQQTTSNHELPCRSLKEDSIVSDCCSCSPNWPTDCRSCSEGHSDHFALSIGLMNARAWPNQPRRGM